MYTDIYITLFIDPTHPPLHLLISLGSPSARLTSVEWWSTVRMCQASHSLMVYGTEALQCCSAQVMGMKEDEGEAGGG